MATITVTPGWAGPLSAVSSDPIVIQVAGVGPQGASGVAPSGTGIVTVTSGVLGTPGPLTGDVTTTAGGLATTLATVNSNVGSFTNASVTVNAKGLVTAASSGAAGGMAIGGTVTSATAGRVLYTASGPVLADDAGLTYDASTDSLTAGRLLTAGISSNSSIVAGSFELQSFAVNNCWLADNAYFDGSTFRRRSAGYAAFCYFTGGEFQIRLGSSSTAGSSLSLGSVPFKVMQDLSVGLAGAGDNLSGSAGFRLHVPATGAMALREASSSTAGRAQSQINSVWADNTDATRTGRITLSAYYTTTAQEGVRVESHSGGTARLGFFGSAAADRQAVGGALTGSETLADVITAFNVLRLALVTSTLFKN